MPEIDRIAEHERATPYDAVDAVRGVGAGTVAGVAGGAVAQASHTSLELSLSTAKVKDATGSYLRALLPAPGAKTDVAGYAYAINGKISGADIYAPSDLFRRLWPRLVKSSAVEAVDARHPGKTDRSVDVAAVRAFLTDMDGAKDSSRRTAGRSDMIVKDTGKAVLFESRDRDRSGAWVHRSYVMKE